MRNALAAAVLTGLLAASAASARADTPNPIPDNLVKINQTQALKLAMATGSNTSVIVQDGSNNYAETDQTGGGNYAGIGQFGDNNYAKIVQNAIGAIAVYNQFGNGNNVTITQTGVSPPPVVVTTRR